jgi:hypothetical protein
MSILKEKDVTFIQDTRVEGNLSIVTHPSAPQYYGDGSVEVGGTLSTDFLKSATPNSVVHLTSPLVQHALFQRPTPPALGQIMMYSDNAFSGRLVMVDSIGTVIDLNPLQKPGDIMTFDAVQNTTVRLPKGRPEQYIESSSSSSTSTGFLWKSQQVNIGNSPGYSDNTMRYVEAQNSTQTSLANTNNNSAQVFIDTPLRIDKDTYVVNNGKITISSIGIYEIIYKVNISFYKSISNLDKDTIASTQIYLEANNTLIPGTRVYSNIPYIPNTTYCTQTLTCRTIINISTIPTTLTFHAQEFETTTNGLVINEWDSHVSISKLAWDADSAQFFTSQGMLDERPVLGSNYITIPIPNIIYRTNLNDVINNDSLQLEIGGFRNIIGKLSFALNNVNPDAQIVILSQLLVNNILLPTSSITECTLNGINGVGTVYINALYDFAAGDNITIQCKLGAGNITTGSIVAIAEDCCIYSILPNTRNFDKIYGTTSIEYTSNPFTYTNLIPDIIYNIDTNAFNITNNAIIISQGGTIQYVLQATIDNNDSSSYDAFVCLCTSSSISEPFKEIPGSNILSVLSPSSSKTIFSSGTLFVPPNSVVKTKFLVPNGGNVIIKPENLNISLVSYEKCIVPFIGLPDFGRFWNYVADDQEVFTTSTEFSLRLAAITIDLPDGNYRIGLTYEWDMSNSGIGFETQLVFDDTTILDSYAAIPSIVGVYQKITSFQQIMLTNGKHSFAFKIRVLDASRAIYTRNVRIEFWKI